MVLEAMRRLITACVSAGTFLLVFLVGFFAYQRITIANLNEKIEKAEAEVAYWERECEKSKDTADFYEDEFYLKWAIEELKLLEGKK